METSEYMNKIEFMYKYLLCVETTKHCLHQRVEKVW